MATMPKQKPGRSKQDYTTPPAFLEALRHKLHIHYFSIDLAASPENAVCPSFYTEEMDSLIQTWAVGGWGFCNPPYADITAWVSKALFESNRGAQVAMLLPAGIGSNWYRDYVDGKTYTLLLNGRLTFGGCSDPYPKDLMVVLFTPVGFKGMEVWDWRKEV